MESIFNLRDLLSSNAECWKQINEIHECPCKMPRESAPDTVKSYKANIINSDFKILLSSAIQRRGSAAPESCVATQTSWRHL